MLMNIFSNIDPMWFNLCYKNFPVLFIILIMSFILFWFKNKKNKCHVKNYTNNNKTLNNH